MGHFIPAFLFRSFLFTPFFSLPKLHFITLFLFRSFFISPDSPFFSIPERSFHSSISLPVLSLLPFLLSF
jgi:hypothetical protein